jgi:hypothetical protein
LSTEEIADEIRRARRGAPAAGHAENEPCANCGVERIGPYCHACGQVGHVHRNLMALVHDLAHGVFHFEGKIWHTLPMLAWRPGELTRRYVDGERTRFVSPMALFLFSVFLLFATASNLTGHRPPPAPPSAADLAKAASQQHALTAKITALEATRARLSDAAAAGAKIDQQIAEARLNLKALKVPDDVRAMLSDDAKSSGDRIRLETQGFGTGLGWFDRSIGHFARNPELAAYKVKSYGYKYSWALIPISVPFIWLLFCWRRDVGLYDHAIFSIYSLAFMSLAVAVLALLSRIGLSNTTIFLAVLLVPPIHIYRQLKGAYGLGRWGALWRTFALLIITSLTSILFVAFLFWMGTG